MAMAVTGALELVVGWLIFTIGDGVRYWDYNEEILNFGNIGGFVCLRSVLVFGVSALMLIYAVVPVCIYLARRMPRRAFLGLAVGLFVVVMMDEVANLTLKNLNLPNAMDFYKSLGATIAMMINIVINNLMRLWVRFRVSLYGDESYLTHTLPVRRSELYLSKFLTGLVTTVCSVLVIFCAAAIAYLTPESFEALKDALSFLAGAMDTTVVKFVLMMAVVFWLEIFSALVVGYLGIILGHRKLTNRMAWSVGFGLLVYVATQAVVMAGVIALSLVDTGVHDLIFGGATEDSALGALKAVTVGAVVLYAVLVGAGHAISQRAFRKVDVE